MTQAQADAAEAAWAKRRANEIEEQRSSALAPALAGNRDAVVQMMVSSDGEERQRWQLLLIELDLAKLASQGIRSGQLSAGTAKNRLCPTCQALDQTIISVHAGARSVMPENCTCLTKGLLNVSGWIKRPDGSGYVDFSSAKD